jgi:hypothetical protein
VSPYTLPKDASELTELARDTEDGWRERNARMSEIQRLVEMWRRTPPDTATHDKKEVITSNEALAQLLKAIAILAGKPPDLNVALIAEDGADRAQRVENWLRHQRHQWGLSHMAAINNPIMTDECSYLLQDGWLCTRLLWNPDPAAVAYPFRCTLLDPYHVFPALTDGAPDFILHCATFTKAEVARDWPRRFWDSDAKGLIDGKKDRDCVKVTAFYTDTQLAAMVDGKAWLKKPVAHGYGFNPLLCITAQGAPYRQRDTTLASSTTPYYDANGTYAYAAFGQTWQRHKGVGLLDAIAQQVRDKEDALSMMRLILAKLAVPGFASFTNSPEDAEDPPRDVGEHARYRLGESLQEIVPAGQALQGQTAFLSALQRGIDTAALGPAAFGAGQYAAGFDRSQASDTATNILLTYVVALQTYYQLLYSRMLRLFSQWGLPSPFLTQTAAGERIVGAPLTREEAFGMDIGVEVRFRSINTQDQMTKVQATALTEFVDIPNPTAEARKVLIAKARQHPVVQEITGFLELAKDAQQNGDALLAQTAGLLAERAVQQMQLALVGGPGNPQAQGPPVAEVGTPNPVNPDENFTNAGAGPNGALLSPAPPEAGLQSLV